MKQNSTTTAQTAQHTPGPWHLGTRPGPIVYGPQGEQVANMHVAMLEQGEHKANARLIAAAPDMLLALENLYARAFAVMDKSATHDGIENCKVLGDARAAIAKATA